MGMTNLHVLIPRELRDRLDAAAEAEGESLGVVVRRMLRAGVEATDMGGEGHGERKVGSRRSGQGNTPGGGSRRAARG